MVLVEKLYNKPTQKFKIIFIKVKGMILKRIR